MKGRSVDAEVDMLAVDMLAVGCRAGLALDAAIKMIGELTPDAFGGRLVAAVAASDETLATALRREATSCPAPGDVVLFVVAEALESGDAVAVTLDRLAGELRRRRRHDVESAARRLPVLMLVPMVCCLLPATLLVTVVPAFIAGLDRIAASAAP